MQQAASAFAAVGTTMLDAGQPDTAVHYLSRADGLLREQQAVQSSEAAVQRAAILGDLGRAHVSRGSINCYYEALALVVDLDEKAADEIRRLQAALPRD